MSHVLRTIIVLMEEGSEHGRHAFWRLKQDGVPKVGKDVELCVGQLAGDKAVNARVAATVEFASHH